MLNNAQFQIIYDGPALQTNEMDVRDLAPALVALSDLLEEVNTLLYNDVAKVQVNVKGSFKTGCFKIDFSIVQSLVDQLVDIFNSREGITAVSVLSILGLSSKDGLIPILKWLNNRKIKTITKIGNGKARIEVDEESREVEEKVIEALSNLKIRQSLEVIITKPLTKEGIETFEISYDSTITTIHESEKESFIAPKAPDELISDQVIEKNLQALNVSFVEGNKWKFTDGNAVFFADVMDNEFIELIQNNKISFAKNDILKVNLRQKQYITDVGMKTEYEIEKIIDHRPAVKQLNLFSDMPA